MSDIEDFIIILSDNEEEYSDENYILNVKNEEIVVDDDYENSIFSASTVEVVVNNIASDFEIVDENQQPSENNENNGDNRDGQRSENNGTNLNPEGVDMIQREIFTMGFQVKVVLDAYVLPRKCIFFSLFIFRDILFFH